MNLNLNDPVTATGLTFLVLIAGVVFILRDLIFKKK